MPNLTFESILNHQWSQVQGRKGRIYVVVKWEGYDEPTWETMEVIKKDDPLTLAKYAKDQYLLETPHWKWAKH